MICPHCGKYVPPWAPSPDDELSEREIDVLARHESGESRTVIAAYYRVSVARISQQLNRALVKTGKKKIASHVGPIATDAGPVSRKTGKLMTGSVAEKAWLEQRAVQKANRRALA